MKTDNKKPNKKKAPRKAVSNTKKKSGGRPVGKSRQPRVQATGIYDPDAPPEKSPPTARTNTKSERLEPDTISVPPETPSAANEEPETTRHEKFMSLGEHLEELRQRIIAMVSVIAVAAIITGVFSYQLHDILIIPYQTAIAEKFPKGLDLLLKTVPGPMIVMFKLSMMVGFTVALPMSFFILWGFITPALSRRAAIIGRLVVAASSLLFWAGLFVCWLYIFPLAMQFMLIGMLPSHTIPQLSLEDYYTFLFWVHIGTGLGFQLPLVIVILAAARILTFQWHKRYWKHIIVGIFVFAAVVTPPDPGTQLILGGSMLVLYGISLLVIWMIERGRR